MHRLAKQLLAAVIAVVGMALAVSPAFGASLRVTRGTTVLRIASPNLIFTDSALGSLARSMTLTMSFPGGTYTCNGTLQTIGSVTGGGGVITSPASGVSASYFGFGANLWTLTSRCELLADGSIRVYLNNMLFRIIISGSQVLTYASGQNNIWFLMNASGTSITGLGSNAIPSDRGTTLRLSSTATSPLAPAVTWALV